MRKLFSRFATVTGSRRSAEPVSDAREKNTAGAANPEQEARMERATSGLANEIDSRDANNTVGGGSRPTVSS
jgi:hypothetical protein